MKNDIAEIRAISSKIAARYGFRELPPLYNQICRFQGVGNAFFFKTIPAYISVSAPVYGHIVIGTGGGQDTPIASQIHGEFMKALVVPIFA